ncbi:WD40 repeat domain-containing serine/threonine protein kinase [bacterium]|nr:WD40 repeat domain-containing serine/threonine protein kinase [bacterium]
MSSNKNSESTLCPDCGQALPPDAPMGLCPNCLMEDAILDPISTVVPQNSAMQSMEGAGSMIGRYKLLQCIGEGGFGVVYMAEQQEPVVRKVALKIIKLGMDTRQVIARFEAERQALAMMDHPNIAKVLDAGSTDTGRPYFVMELVKGESITRFCNEHGLSSDQRLLLFMDVCAAVQHAHQKGVIHRDIKPSNILVMLHEGQKPMPKVIDFGIAKATQQRLTEKTLFTEYHQMLGTPAYMSPEQAQFSGLDTDTRSDIYSLGVLLYELLSGKTPFDQEALAAKGYEEMCRKIREEDPPAPSKRWNALTCEEKTTQAKLRGSDPTDYSRMLKGELDWIVMKAIEKDRRRRYETANALRTDIGRFLAQEPVEAVAPSSLYLFKKFAIRNMFMIGAGTAIGAALILGTSLAAWQAVKAHQKAEIATQKTKEAVTAQFAADQARENERQQRTKAENSERQVKRSLYAADMLLAQYAAEDRDVKTGLDLLERFIPNSGEIDHRGWSWRYYYGRLIGKGITKRMIPTAHEMALSNDGRFLAIAGGDISGVAVLKLPHLELHQTILTQPVTDWITRMAFSEDDSALYLTGRGIDGVKKYSLKSGRPQPIVPDGYSNGQLARISPNQKWLLTLRNREGNLNHALEISDLQTGQIAATSPTFSAPDHSTLDQEIRISPDSQKVSVSLDGSQLMLYSIPDLKPIHRIDTSGDVAVVAWSPDSRSLVSGYEYPLYIDLWDVESGSHQGRMQSEQFGPSRELSFSKDGSTVACISLDDNINVWNAESLQLIETIPGRRESTTSIIFLDNGATLASIGSNGIVSIHELGTAKNSLVSLGSNEDTFQNVIYSPGGDRLIALNSEGEVYFFDANSRQFLYKLSPNRGQKGRSPRYVWANPMAISQDGLTLISSNKDEGITIYDLSTLKPKRLLEGHTSPVVNVRLSSDKQWIASTSENGELILWERSTGRVVRKEQNGHFCDFHPDPDTSLLAVGGENFFGLFNYQTEEWQTAESHPDVWSVTFSPKGDSVAVGLVNEVRIYTIPDLKLQNRISGPRGPVPMVTFHPEGHTIAIPSWSGYLHLWNTNIEGIVGRMPIPKDWTVNAHFSSDGKSLVTSTIGAGIHSFSAPSMDTIVNWQSENDISVERTTKLAEAWNEAKSQALNGMFSPDPGSINQWLILGPLPITDPNAPLDDLMVQPDKLIDTIDEGTSIRINDTDYEWLPIHQKNPRFNFSKSFINSEGTSGQSVENSLVYGVCYVNSDQTRNDLVFHIGGDDQSILFLNGNEIHRNLTRKNHWIWQDKVSGTELKKGRNTVIFIVRNFGGSWAGSVVITDTKNQPVDGIHISIP